MKAYRAYICLGFGVIVEALIFYFKLHTYKINIKFIVSKIYIYILFRQKIKNGDHKLGAFS